MVKIVGAVVGVLSSIIDGILINRLLGNDSMSAYGLAMPIMLFYVAFGGMFATGIQAVVGKAIGKGDSKTINKTYTSTIIFSIILSTLIGILSFVFAKPIAELLGAKGVNILANCYEAAGQSVIHYHVHVIPRYNTKEGFELTNETYNVIVKEVLCK